jgi:hypothetical protein
MDYAEILRALSDRGARFAVAGGFACLAHGVVRLTLDLDLLVEVSDDNLACLIRIKRAAGREKDLVDVRELERLV